VTDDADGIDIRHLRYFLAVVRAGTISGAAAELHIAQPSLSQQLLRLERRVGAELFARSRNGVALTASGEAFLRGVENIPGQLQDAISAAVAAPSAWVLGVCTGVPAEVLTEVDRAVTARARELGRAGPRTALEVRSVPSSGQLRLLRQGELTFGILRLPMPQADLVLATVSERPMGIVLHKAHPLTAKAALTAADLAGQRLVWFDTRRAPDYARTLLAQLASMGWRPALHQLDSDRHILFRHVLATTDDLVAVRPEVAVRSDDTELTWRPLAGAGGPRERLAVAALADSMYGEIVRDMAQSRNWPCR
jgi:DNA-binding transcriptional LysR family regulator